MKKLLGLNQDYQQLKDLGLIGSDFQQFQITLIQKYIRTLSHLSNASCQKEIESILKILNDQNKNSLASIKILVFVNMLINEKEDQNKDIGNKLVNQQINKILDLETRRYDKIKKWRQRESSISKGIDWVRQTFSRSKDKDKKIKSRSYTMTQVTFRQSDKNMNTSRNEINQANTPKQNKDSKDSKDSKDQSKQQLIISKIIIPYATYLLKLSCSNMSPIVSANYQQLDSAKMWKTINLLKCVLKISQSFTVIMRYYQKQLSDVITIMIAILNNQIKVYYPILQTHTVQKKKTIARQVMLSKINDKAGQLSKLQVLEQVINKYELDQFKEILNEASAIRQSTIIFYRSSTTINKIILLNIPLPGKYLQEYDSNEIIVYNVLEQAEKYRRQEKAKKQRSQSKNKNNMSNASLRMKLQLSKETPKINSKNKSITDIKSSLIGTKQVDNSIKQTLQTLPTAKNIHENTTTFRRLRMGMTQQLHGEETKRQRR